MEEIKLITAENISRLRVNKGLTQAELAKILNYSDKAVSKWERGESLPDVIVLKQIADLFQVTLDYLISPHTDEEIMRNFKTKWMSRNHLIITAISVLGVWFLAIALSIFGLSSYAHFWLVYIAAIPISFIVLLVFNSLWGNLRLNFVFISFLIWTLLTFIYLATLKYNYWLLFVTGIPLQLAAALAFRFKLPQKDTKG